MNGLACESGKYTLGNIDGNGRVTIEPHSNNITSVAIGTISANGKVTINANNESISKVEFVSISNNGKLIINSNHVKEIEGIDVSANGYVCVTDSDYNNDVNITMNFSNNAKLGKCGESLDSDGYFWLSFVVPFFVFTAYCLLRGKKSDSNGKPPLPTTETKLPSAPTPIPSVTAIPVPPIDAEPNIHVL